MQPFCGISVRSPFLQELGDELELIVCAGLPPLGVVDQQSRMVRRLERLVDVMHALIVGAGNCGLGVQSTHKNTYHHHHHHHPT